MKNDKSNQNQSQKQSQNKDKSQVQPIAQQTKASKEVYGAGQRKKSDDSSSSDFAAAGRRSGADLQTDEADTESNR